MYKAELSIKKWAEEDRPREKLMLKGKAALSDAELLGIILGSGTRSLSAVDLSKYILSQVGNNLNELAKYSVSDLTKFKGIGPAKAISIVSALELGRRRKASEVLEKPKITCSTDAYEVIKPYLMDLHHEEFWLLLLNRSNLVMATHKVSSGGISGTVADPKIIFKKALEVSCSAVILVHNHPSGNLNPSSADIKLTKKLVEAGKLLDLPILDHLIFTDHAHFSFADEGMI
ncbi:DNA repair protein RadC [Flammeovirgaceae bacterium SG7u.111]|nr:DNA repair protein RadC [Flammeovirgaceae bacterium SG7u.132]WPO37632.1 DNA repair protein RadC [Flammeovirgaceae bacterium SG7u.111]